MINAAIQWFTNLGYAVILVLVALLFGSFLWGLFDVLVVHLQEWYYYD